MGTGKDLRMPLCAVTTPCIFEYSVSMDMLCEYVVKKLMIGLTRQTSATQCPNWERSLGFSTSLCKNNQHSSTLACQLLTEVSVGGN